MMDARQALAYCASKIIYIDNESEFESPAVYDRFNDPHWIEWSGPYGLLKPTLCAESPWPPFHQMSEPFTKSKKRKIASKRKKD